MTDDPLTPDDRATLARLLRRILRDAKFPFSDANSELRRILEKLEPPPPEKKPAPPPLPTGRSGVLESRKRQRRSRVLPG
jgi:hypothetical protein